MTLIEFLLARIAEDEAIAWTHEVWPNQARVLAECEAKRHIIKIHQPVQFTDISINIIDETVCHTCHAVLDSPFEDEDDTWEYPLIQQHYPCKTLRATALPYADHPDYQQEWRP